MQQPQHVLTASYFSTAFIFRLALLTYKGTENWKSQLLPTVRTIQEGTLLLFNPAAVQVSQLV